MGSPVEPLRKIPAAARLLGVRPSLLARRDWREKNAIPTVRVGRAVRFDCNQLQSWLSTRQERPATPDEGSGPA